MSEIVIWSDDTVTAALEVHAADSPMEFQRWRLRAQVQNSNGQFKGETSWLHMYAWPEMAVCVTGDLTIKGKDGQDNREFRFDRGHVLPFDVYLALPDSLIVEIEDSLYRLNPQWVIRPAETADSEKKGQTSSTAG